MRDPRFRKRKGLLLVNDGCVATPHVCNKPVCQKPSFKGVSSTQAVGPSGRRFLKPECRFQTC